MSHSQPTHPVEPPAEQEPEPEPDDVVAARAAMVDALVADGAVVDPRVEAALRAVRRDVLVPRVVADPNGLRGPSLDATSDRGGWLTTVYANTTLLIETHQRAPRTSGTLPSLTAVMLEALDLHGHETVLEVGTGTGYTTALLCHLVGQDRVSSLDLEADLIEHATTRLATLGIRPTLTARDGATGWPERARFDRILGTCSVRRIPDPWIDQLRDGGRIVVPLRGGLAVVTRHRPGHATGRFHPSPAYFMPLRPAIHYQPIRDGDGDGDPVEPGSSPARPTGLGAFETFYQRDARFLLDLALPDLRVAQHGPRLDALTVSDPAGSTARLHPDADADGRITVDEQGPRQLWREVEATIAHWAEHGRPHRDRYGITINGPTQNVWLDTPDGPSWTLGRQDE